MKKWLCQHSYVLRLQIAKISLRERYLLLLTMFAAVMLIVHGILVATGMQSNTDVLNRIDNAKAQSQQLQQTLSDYQKAINNPSLLALQRDNAQLASSIDRLKLSINQVSERLMAPERMNALLRDLLERQTQLTLQSFQVLPVEKIQSSAENQSLFYRHGIELKLKGRFEALTAYLAAIETTAEGDLFWDDLIINTDNFPILDIDIKVHTLSQNEEWINV